MREGAARQTGRRVGRGEGMAGCVGKTIVKWKSRGVRMGLCLAFFLSLLASLQPVGAFTLRNPPPHATGEVGGEAQGEGQGQGQGVGALGLSQVDGQVRRPHLAARDAGDSNLQLPSSLTPSSISGSSSGSDAAERPLAPALSVQGQDRLQEVQGKGAAPFFASDVSSRPGKTQSETRHRLEQTPSNTKQQAGDIYSFSGGDILGSKGRAVTLTSLVEVAAAAKKDIKKEFQGVDLSSRPQALLQEVSQSDLPKHQGTSMAVGIVLGVAALCGLMMAALFQCCCRKKRSNSDSQDQDGVKATQGSLPHTRTPSPQPAPQAENVGVPQEEDRESESHRLLDEDLGDFSAVQRETEILKSFRKPPPPKNRGKATRAARQKQEPTPPKEDLFPSLPDTQTPEAAKEFKDSSLAAVDVSAKRASMELLLADALVKDKGREESKERGSDKSREEDEEDGLLQEPPPPARRITPTRETTTPTRGERTPPRREATPKLEESTASTSTERPSSFVEGFANGGNIFMQIDPTVKRSLEKAKNGSKIPVTSRRSATSPTESPMASPLIKPDRRTPDRRTPDRRSPQPQAESPPLIQPPAPSPRLRPGIHRKFLVPSVHGEQMDELLKSLKTRLQEDSTVDSSSLSGQSKPQQEDATDNAEPKGRDRSYSDSSKPKRPVKHTDL